MFPWDVYTSRLILVATMFNLFDENCLWIANLFSILLTEGDCESPAPPLMQLESETERNGFIITSTFVDLKKYIFYHLVGEEFAPCLNTFKMTKDKNLKIWIHCQKSLFEAHVEKSRHVGRGGGQRGAADDCSSDVATIRRRMALAAAAWAGLKFVNFLASEIFSGEKDSWIRIKGGQRCCCFNFGPWQSWVDEEMTTDVSDGPAFARFDGWHWKRLSLCLKRPSFYCLIHFYKRCVSSLAQMGRSPWVRSGWVSVLSVTTFFIQG